MAAAVAGLFFTAAHSIPRNKPNRRHLKGVTDARTQHSTFDSNACRPGPGAAAQAQVVIGVDVGIQPVCQYGYYDYAPYACSPYGFYGPGYFYNGIFLGMGPWAGWGYGHGWGGHRFENGGGGSYRGGGGEAAGRVMVAAAAAEQCGAAVGAAMRSGGGGHATAARVNGSNAGGARPSAGHAAVSRGGGGGAARGGGGGGGAPSSGGGGGGGQAHGGGGGKHDRELEHFHNFYKVDLVVSHPFHREREMDGAQSFLTLSVKVFLVLGNRPCRRRRSKPVPPFWFSGLRRVELG